VQGDPFVPVDALGRRDDTFLAPEPVLQHGVAAGGGTEINPDALTAPAIAASVFARDAKAIAAAVGQGPPPGTPGFMTGFQVGALNTAWAREIDALATHLEGVSRIIHRTRQRYYETESAVSGSFASGG